MLNGRAFIDPVIAHANGQTGWKNIKLLLHVFAYGFPAISPKKCQEIDLQNVTDFYAFTQRNLNRRNLKLDCPSKIKVANGSLAAAVVEG